ncbi:GNAT family N-acetyltransferase [Virgibacillus indicus]|uniref:GNAT family N-acetyltransferase n=1 Tax=Virgibacillus indicus TaxID=2024554 RepID=A0A265NBD1_9BACI|nr:GNAT family N-acetyltransferase [Virgibacillus indicus]OZU89137.1 GNAT family N-acetyltransferase [Virgibacillus indicus]
MGWHIKTYKQLTKDELYALLKARVDVFVVEQECPYPELDNYDQESIHLFLKVNGEIAASVRVLPKNSKYPEVSIGRVMVVKKFRGNNFAREIMQKAMDFVVDEWKERTIKIQGQLYLKTFYTSLGFRQISKIYLEDDIPHIDMLWEQK